jgi:hypothetical protein
MFGKNKKTNTQPAATPQTEEVVEQVVGQATTKQESEEETDTQVSESSEAGIAEGEGDTKEREDSAVDTKGQAAEASAEGVDRERLQNIAMKVFEAITADVLYFTADGQGFTDRRMAESCAACTSNNVIFEFKRKQ